MVLLPLVFPCFAIALSMGLAEDVGIWDEVVDLTNTLSFLAFEDEAVVVATLLRGVLPCLCAQRSLEKVRAANKSVAISNVFFIFNIIFNFQLAEGQNQFSIVNSQLAEDLPSLLATNHACMANVVRSP